MEPNLPARGAGRRNRPGPSDPRGPRAPRPGREGPRARVALDRFSPHSRESRGRGTGPRTDRRRRKMKKLAAGPCRTEAPVEPPHGEQPMTEERLKALHELLGEGACRQL